MTMPFVRSVSTLGVALALAGPLSGQIANELEVQQLIPINPSYAANAGGALDMEGDWLTVGALADSAAYGNQGSVRVYHWDKSRWVEHDKLFAADGGAYDNFGTSLSLDGDTLVVGAVGHDFGVPNQGMAYAFRLQGDEFVEEQNLFPSGVSVNNYYGSMVEASEGRAFVYGSFDDTPGLDDQAALFVFHRTPAGWVEDERIVLEGPNPFDGWGQSFAVSGNLLAWGNAVADNVEIFEFADGAWSPQATLLSTVGAAWFGWSVALSGERLAVGAAADEGRVFVYHRDGESWVEEPVVSPPLTPSAALGMQVDLAGSFLVAAADSYDVVENAEGAVFMFRWDGAAWVPTNMLTASDSEQTDLVGYALGMSGPMVVAGAPNHWVDGPPITKGVAYSFDTLAPGWSFRGGSVAGDGGYPVLTGAGELDGGDSVTLALEQCAPGAPVVMLIGLSAVHVPFKGGVLVPQPDLLIGGLVTSPQGTLDLSATWPTLPSGTSLYFQDWIVDASAPAGLAASNAVRALVP